MLAERISRQEYAEKLIQGPQQGSAVQGGVGVVSADGAGAPVQGVGKEQPKITMPELRRKQHRYKLLLKQFEKNPEYAEELGLTEEKVKGLLKEVGDQIKETQPPEQRAAKFDSDLKIRTNC